MGTQKKLSKDGSDINIYLHITILTEVQLENIIVPDVLNNRIWRKMIVRR
jgi:hypothetical protein